MIISTLITLALIGFFVWAVENYVTMPPRFMKLFEFVALIATVLWLLDTFGIYHIPYRF